LTRDKALENYRRAEKLCAEVVRQHGDAPGLYEVRKYRIIALLGMWKLSCEPKYIKLALAEAKASLAATFPAGADVAARFCVAKDALERGDADAESVVSEFLTDCGGDTAPASAVAAAAILSLDAGSRKLYEEYRRIFLAEHGDNPRLHAVAAFLRNRQHQFRVLEPNHGHRERWARGYIVNHTTTPIIDPLPRIELKHLDGRTLILPRDTTDKMTILLFVEPPADADRNFPVSLNQHGKPTMQDIHGMMGYAQDLSDRHVNRGIDVVTVFLCDDADRVKWLMKKNEWTCQAVMLPGGMASRVVGKLGLLSADRMANVYLLRRDGTVAWWGLGPAYKEFARPWVYMLAMKIHIETCEVEVAYRALSDGDYERAARVFSGPFLPWRPDRYGWRPPRYHGKALAHMGLSDWNSALEAIDSAIDAHKLRYFQGRRNKRVEDWRKDAATVVITETCDILGELWTTKAVILEKLGRKDEAAALQRRASTPTKSDREDVYKSFHDKLEALRRSEAHRAATISLP
jgi:hypothetical protein